MRSATLHLAYISIYAKNLLEPLGDGHRICSPNDPDHDNRKILPCFGAHSPMRGI